MRINLNGKALVADTVMRARVIEGDDGLLYQKLNGLQALIVELKACLGMTLAALSNAREMGGDILVDLLLHKKSVQEKCISYVKDMEQSLVRRFATNQGFYYSPRSFATPSWTWE